MQVANVKQRQILPRMGKIWTSTPQNREEIRRNLQANPTGPGGSLCLTHIVFMVLPPIEMLRNLAKCCENFGGLS